MTKREDELLRVQRLAAELDAGGRTVANHAVALLGMLDSSKDEMVLKAAIHALKLFFVDVSQEGDLAPKKADGENGGDSAPDAASAEDVYRQWLRRHYSVYTAVVLRLLSVDGTPANLQVAAATALMEAVRCEQGVGVFASGLFTRLVTVLATSGGVQPEVFTLMFTHYFHHADVRYYTLLAVRDTARAARSARKRADFAPSEAAAAGDAKLPTPAAAAGQAKRSRTEAGTASTTSTAAAAPVEDEHMLPSEDVARNLYDILAALPERCAGAVGTSQDATESGELTSWVGLEEAGVIKASADRSESAKSRRKRKATAAAAGGAAAARAAAATEQRAVWANMRAQRRMFSEAWLSLLSLPIPADIYRKVLLRLHASVLPNMTNPVLLADFLTYSLNQGGITGMLALDGIFVLVTQHGLEYPQFYDRLYQLITPDTFAAKHRAQFFKLADVFLSSGLVPAYTAAAFAKKMARLALSAPPAGAMIAVAFIHNLIRRHPSCMVLLDRAPGAASDGAEASGAGEDVFDEHEQDPSKCRAVESSLWEVLRLRNHYCPQVSALCTVLDKDLTDRQRTNEMDLDALLLTSYSSLFKQEVERKLRQVPLAFYQQPPSKLFDVNCEADFCGWQL